VQLLTGYDGAMNLANTLTIGRLVLAPVFFVLVFLPVWAGVFQVGSVALLWIIFAAIEISDAADGKIARSRDEVTDLGKVMDPFADVISRLTYFVAFTAIGIMPAWILLVILYREYGIVFIRLLLIRKGVALAARPGGKIKAVLYAVSGGAGIALITIERIGVLPQIFDGMFMFAQIVYVAAALFAIGSFVDYLVIFKQKLAA